MSSLQEIFDRMVPGFRKIFGDVLYQIILYGSTARGDQTQESDVDIAVIVRSYTEKMYDEMIDLTVDLELEYNKVLSVLLIDYDNYKEWGTVPPFYQNVVREGVVLWQTA